MSEAENIDRKDVIGILPASGAAPVAEGDKYDGCIWFILADLQNKCMINNKHAQKASLELIDSINKEMEDLNAKCSEDIKSLDNAFKPAGNGVGWQVGGGAAAAAMVGAGCFFGPVGIVVGCLAAVAVELLFVQPSVQNDMTQHPDEKLMKEADGAIADDNNLIGLKQGELSRKMSVEFNPKQTADTTFNQNFDAYMKDYAQSTRMMG